jgi:hypothetical protein
MEEMVKRREVLDKMIQVPIWVAIDVVQLLVNILHPLF